MMAFSNLCHWFQRVADPRPERCVRGGSERFHNGFRVEQENIQGVRKGLCHRAGQPYRDIRTRTTHGQVSVEDVRRCTVEHLPHECADGELIDATGCPGPGQTSVLAIDLTLPADGTVTFSIKTATVDYLDQCQFLIDTASIAQFSGITDWKVATYPLKAGNHTLAWKSRCWVSTAGKIWVDNIFLPPHALVTFANAGESAIPVAFLLYQNYPNPFNPTTTIRYGLPQRSPVTLTIYNMLGQQVALLQNGEQGAGYHEVKFDARNLGSGVYFYKLHAGDFVETRRLLLVR